MTLLASLVGTLIFHCLIKHFDLNLRAKLRSNAALLFAKKTKQSLSNLCDSYSLLDIYETRFFSKYIGITDEPASLKNRTTLTNFLCFKILTLNKIFRPIRSFARVLYTYSFRWLILGPFLFVRFSPDLTTNFKFNFLHFSWMLIGLTNPKYQFKS